MSTSIEIHEECQPGATRISVRGHRPTTVEIDDLVALVERLSEGASERVVVDLNSLAHVEAATVERLMKCRGDGTRAMVAIDLSQRHGPSLLDLLARLLDPGVDVRTHHG